MTKLTTGAIRLAAAASLIAAVAATVWAQGGAAGEGDTVGDDGNCTAGAEGCECNQGDGSCTVGAETCECTQGGACDPGLECLSGLCVDPNGGGTTSPEGTCDPGLECLSGICVDPNAGAGGSSNTTTLSSGSGGQTNCQEGCTAVDVLFAIDHTGSMAEEIAAISATQAFTGIIDALSAVNCGDIDYRIGVTDDNTPSFVTGSGKPWFDSTEMSKDEIVTAFNQAAQSIGGQPPTPTGCEHVLTNATNLLTADQTEFLRTEALLVLILLTDVDDYGSYDQNSFCPGLGLCSAAEVAAQTNYNNLVALKSGLPEAVSAVVIAGDPNGNSLMSNNGFCNQPGACNCTVDCEVYDAIKLWDFTQTLGSNGVFHNLCLGGAGEVPNVISDAFTDQIDLACQGLEPPK